MLININFPDLVPEKVKGVMMARQGQRKLGENLDRRVDPRGRPYYWIGTQRDEGEPGRGTDLEAVCDGFVSVTPVHLDLTHRASIKPLREALA